MNVGKTGAAFLLGVAALFSQSAAASQGVRASAALPALNAETSTVRAAAKAEKTNDLVGLPIAFIAAVAAAAVVTSIVVIADNNDSPG